ncbi:STAS domain-containing protein [Streptomyces longwoodensis]|uniref:STAS domain-containing protein n=1 Tax=Streptomyces longwoodensis TaxID=68231 RepID=UPI003810CD2A
MDPTTPPVLTLTGPATRSEVAGLCDAVRALLEVTAGRVVVCDVTGAGPPDLPVVDTLARLELAARRAGGHLRLRGADPALRALLGLVGIPFEMEGDPEQREPPLGVEEEVEPGEAAV